MEYLNNDFDRTKQIFELDDIRLFPSRGQYAYPKAHTVFTSSNRGGINHAYKINT
jgi:hypothetical protein